MTVKTLEQKLKQSGYRMSGQRSLIYGIIKKSERHLDADEIYRLARAKSPRISLSTVYRTLGKLKELGMIDEVHFGQEHHHYEQRQPGEHYHLVCQHCGLVIEFEYPLTRQIKDNVPETRDFEILNAEVNMQGLCKKCKNDRRKE